MQKNNEYFLPRKKKNIADTLYDLVNSGYSLTQNFVREVIMIYFRNLKPEELHNPKISTFNCSRKFLSNFLKRIRFSRRRAHLKRRPQANPSDIMNFREKVELLFATCQDDHILNADETFWRCADQTFYTWAPIGYDNIHIYTSANEKAGFTALATIDHNGNTLPLVLVGKGKTKRCEKSQFGFTNSLDIFCEPVPELPYTITDENEDASLNENETSTTRHYTTHSLSGWVNASIWKQYLHFLRAHIPYIPNTEPNDARNTIYLICDGFTVHHNDAAQIEARALNISLIAVPNGATDECQPLDRRIFGALKSRLRSELNKHISTELLEQMKKSQTQNAQANPTTVPPVEMPHFTKSHACGLLMNYWDNMPAYQVLNGWQTAIYGKETSEDV